MTPELKEKIQRRAYEIYEYHKDNELLYIFDRGEIRLRTSDDDWFDAQSEVLSERAQAVSAL